MSGGLALFVGYLVVLGVVECAIWLATRDRRASK